MKSFKLLPLSSAVLSVLFAGSALAQTASNDTAVLDTVVVTDNQGLKVKSNVVTTQVKDESVETDLRGLFKNEPSITMGGGTGTSAHMYLRGMGQNSVDVKVDNAYSDSQIHYHQSRHMLDPALVKVVAVQKGAGSASAGIGQTNGAIVAKTVDVEDLLKNSSDPNFGAKVNTGISTNHEHNYGLSLFGKNEVADFVVAGNRVKSSDYRAGRGVQNGIDGSNRIPFSAMDKRSYLVKLGLNLGEHRFVLSHMNDEHHGLRTVREEFSADASLPRGGLSLGVGGQSPKDRKMTVSNTNLEWKAKDLGFIQEANANIYHLVHGRWSADDSGNSYAGSNNNPVGVATKVKVDTVGANLNLDSNITENILLKYGVNYRQQEVKPAYRFEKINNQEKQDVGFYVEGLTSIVDNVLLTTGLRYDHFDYKAMDGKKASDGAFNPSVGIIYEPIQHLSLSASHNYATRSPRMQDALMAHGYRGRGGTVSIAQNTKAEQARSTEIGFNYDNGTLGLEGSYFWQTIKDALVRSDSRASNHACPATVANCYSELYNGGTIKNRGYELSGFYKYNGLTARLGVAHSKPRFYGNNFVTNSDYAAVIGRTWTASLAYRFEKPNLEIGVHHRHIEGVKTEDNIFVIQDTATPATEGKNGYRLTDITANWKPFGTDKMNVNFAVNNVSNKKYRSHAQKGTVATALYGAGREYRIGVNYKF